MGRVVERMIARMVVNPALRLVKLLAEAGLAPLRVLQLATTGPARFLGREDVAGTVEAGRDADLVLLAADPTASATHLRAIDTVVAGGVVHGRAELQAVRDGIRVG